MNRYRVKIELHDLDASDWNVEAEDGYVIIGAVEVTFASSERAFAALEIARDAIIVAKIEASITETEVIQ